MARPRPCRAETGAGRAPASRSPGRGQPADVLHAASLPVPAPLDPALKAGLVARRRGVPAECRQAFCALPPGRYAQCASTRRQCMPVPDGLTCRARQCRRRSHSVEQTCSSALMHRRRDVLVHGAPRHGTMRLRLGAVFGLEIVVTAGATRNAGAPGARRRACITTIRGFVAAVGRLTAEGRRRLSTWSAASICRAPCFASRRTGVPFDRQQRGTTAQSTLPGSWRRG